LIGTTAVPTPSPGTAAPIVLLAQPNLSHAEVVRAAGLRHYVIDDIDRSRVGKQQDSSRHGASPKQSES
jgi:hypothetical protein